MKDIIGNSEIELTSLPRNVRLTKCIFIINPKKPDTVNYFFTNIGQKLTRQISKSSKKLVAYINKVNVTMNSKPLLINRLKDAFLWQKINKSSGAEILDSILLKSDLGYFANS